MAEINQHQGLVAAIKNYADMIGRIIFKVGASSLGKLVLLLMIGCLALVFFKADFCGELQQNIPNPTPPQPSETLANMGSSGQLESAPLDNTKDKGKKSIIQKIPDSSGYMQKEYQLERKYHSPWTPWY